LAGYIELGDLIRSVGGRKVENEKRKTDNTKEKKNRQRS
jgi:hypothetical protein